MPFWHSLDAAAASKKIYGIVLPLRTLLQCYCRHCSWSLLEHRGQAFQLGPTPLGLYLIRLRRTWRKMSRKHKWRWSLPPSLPPSLKRMVTSHLQGEFLAQTSAWRPRSLLLSCEDNGDVCARHLHVHFGHKNRQMRPQPLPSSRSKALVCVSATEGHDTSLDSLVWALDQSLLLCGGRQGCRHLCCLELEGST